MAIEREDFIPFYPQKTIKVKIRRYYSITELGKEELREAHSYLKELTRELEEEGEKPYE